MNTLKGLWSLRYVFGMLLAFGLSIAAFVLAVKNYPMYVGVGVIILGGLIVINQPRVRRERERTNKLLDTAFQDAYAQLSPPPAMVRSYSYGYPAFEIKFRSKIAMEAAATRNETFKAQIGIIFKDHGPRIRPFNADMAIFFTYDGYLDELRARNHTWDRSLK
jgi:hypothetical protein